MRFDRLLRLRSATVLRPGSATLADEESEALYSQHLYLGVAKFAG